MLRITAASGLAFVLGLAGFGGVCRAAAQQRASQPRDVRSLDAQWKFLGDDARGAELPAFDDSKWQVLDVPHDWSIAGPMVKTNPSGQGGAYLPTGVGWYRKELTLAPTDARRHVYLAFDGVMANSDVWINGFHLGRRPNGTVSFYYDLTAHLKFGPGATNVVAVRCDNAQQPASRWYEGGGIYRPVRLVSMHDVHVAPWGVFVSTPSATAEKAVVHVESAVEDEGVGAVKAALTVSLINPEGKVVATQDLAARSVAPGGGVTKFLADISLPRPELWDLDHPAMYRAVVRVKVGSTVMDEEQESFGIHEFHFDAATGFWLNGKNFKIKGVALHIDGSAVGIAVPMAVYEHRLLALRALGVNAIRTAHNPPSPEFLDLCDRLGFLIMDEMFDCWTVAKNPFDYHLYFKDWYLRDTRDTVMRDRNHPSIILYSAGNEIHDTPQTELAHGILEALVKEFHENDPTRPVTQALFRPNVSHDYDNGLADLLDVVGQNYRENEILAAHEAKPARKIIGTENGHDRAIWLALRDHPAYSGQFLWTGVDYLGEAGEAGGWPIFANGSGLLDRTGYVRARGLERESWWQTAPNVHMVRRVAPTERLSADPGYEAAPARFRQSLFVDWTPEKADAHTKAVEVYTNCDEVELLLNGASLGRQTLHADASPLTWTVPYAAGELKAVGYNSGKQVTKDVLRTAGKAAGIAMSPEQIEVSNGADDLVFVEARLTDAAGTMLPETGRLIKFAVSGPGEIVAVDSGSNVDHDDFQAKQRKTFEGRAVVMVRATAASGVIKVTATADGVAETTAVIKAVPGKAQAVRSF